MPRGFGEIGKDLGQDPICRIKIIGDLRFSRDIGTRKVQLCQAFKVTVLHLFQDGMGLFRRHADER